MTDPNRLLEAIDEQVEAAADEVARSVVQYIEAAADGDPEAVDLLVGRVMAAVSAMRE